ncbi:MAG TPA: hypothetical protein VGB70_05090 [Allosphingosinicella sp.]|jgi:hypothetical protein
MRSKYPAGRAAALGLALLAAAAPVQAQLAPGYSGQSGTRTASGEEYVWALGELGSCLAKSKAQLSAEFLATRRGTPAEGAAAKRLLGRNTSCLRLLNEMGVERGLLRGAVAEALYEKAAPTPPAPVSAAAAAAGRMTTAQLKALGYDGLIESVTGCWAAKRPDLVHSLLLDTKLGSDAEAAAVEAMTPRFAECLPTNVKLNLAPSELRLALAEAAYKRVAPPRAPTR